MHANLDCGNPSHLYFPRERHRKKDWTSQFPQKKSDLGMAQNLLLSLGGITLHYPAILGYHSAPLPSVAQMTELQHRARARLLQLFDAWARQGRQRGARKGQAEAWWHLIVVISTPKIWAKRGKQVEKKAHLGYLGWYLLILMKRKVDRLFAWWTRVEIVEMFSCPADRITLLESNYLKLALLSHCWKAPFTHA